MDISESPCGEILKEKDICRLIDKDEVGVMIGYEGMEKKKVSELIQFVRTKLKRIPCGANHHLNSIFYGVCHQHGINTACGHREKIVGLMWYILGLLIIIKKRLHLPTLRGGEKTRFQKQIRSYPIFANFDIIGLKYHQSSDLLGDIAELQKRQDEEAQDIEKTLKELTDILEEMVLLEPSLKSLIHLPKRPKTTKANREILPILTLSHQN